MKIKTFALIFVCFQSALNSQAQIDSATVDSLLREYVDIWDSSGVYTFKPNKLSPGELFTLYKSYFIEDTFNDLILEKEWIDHSAGFLHSRYRQYHKDILVEGAMMQEHVRGEYVHYANGKVALLSDSTDTAGIISPWEALNSIWNTYGFNEEDYEWPWFDIDWEKDLREESGNPSATYFPMDNAALLWALTSYGPFGHVIPEAEYTLAWKFEVFCLNPYFKKYFFVDARTGDVFRSESATISDGIAATPNHGDRLIDTKPKLGYHILKATGNGHNFHTKYWSSLAWPLVSNVTDDDDTWGSSEQDATSVHWMLGEAWDFFDSEYQISGVDGNQKKIRINAQTPTSTNIRGAEYDPNENSADEIYFGYYANSTEDYCVALDVVGHEYTHGIVVNTSNLYAQGESGAIHESYADIFGTIIEGHVEGSITNWTLAEDITSDLMYSRSMETPKDQYRHFTETSCDESSLEIGQPDTYEGDFWEFGSCDNFGVHINNGVQNRWFYLLANGGSGQNDNGDTYSVQGIGLEDAEFIAFNTMVSLDQYASYNDARASSIAQSIIEWGVCSEQHIQCASAWRAVGMGGDADCSLFGSDEETKTSYYHMNIYPNPASEELRVTANLANLQRLKIFNLVGGLVYEDWVQGHTGAIDVSTFPSGTYFVVMTGDSVELRQKVVIISEK